MGRALLGVAGRPVGHSRSPAMHNAALAEMGLDWLYVPLPLPERLFGPVVAALGRSGFRGLNVTVPHKLAALELADRRSPAATAIGAANTLTLADGGVHAENTDAAGFLDALEEDPRGMRALVLGAGGAARAVAWALSGAGADVAVLNRTPERSEALARDLGVRHARAPEPADLLVNCTTVGLGAADDALAALGVEAMEPPAIAVDLVYGDAPSTLLAWAERGGARVVDGLEVLVRQGALSLERWTGARPSLATMRRAARHG